MVPAAPLMPQLSDRPLLEMCNIGKNFPGIRALQGVNFDLRPGEIHALVGENGAGKSTLMKVLAGIYSQFEGEIRIDGIGQHFGNVHDSARAGVAMVFQELSLVPEMSVAENIFLGRLPQRRGIVQWESLHARTVGLLKELRLEVSSHEPVRHLGVGQQQVVEIAKGLSQNARILVLDEPTAALTGVEEENLFSVLSGLRQRGIGVIYISHRLSELFRIADRITVLRDGRSIGTQNTQETDEGRVIAMMVGREAVQIFAPKQHSPGGVVLEAQHITSRDANGREVVHDVSFSVRRGEILGIGGLLGAGRTEVLMSLYGSYSGRVTRQILISGKPVSVRTPADAIRHGISFVTEDRRRYGLVLEQTILHNMTLSALRRISRGFIAEEDLEIAATRPIFDDLQIKAESLFQAVRTLSGGNQQKVVLSKCLLTEPQVLLLDEPTRGMDVGAKQEIYVEIEKLVQCGLAVVMVSSELPELLALADRIIVLYQGRINGEFTRESACPEAVMACATGQSNSLSILNMPAPRVAREVTN